MIRIGIDYSLNSPSVCFEYDDRIEFISFFNADGLEWNREKPLKKFYYHNELNKIMTMIPYNRTKLEKKCSYSEEQIAKMKDAKMMADTILDVIEEMCGDDNDITISLEGFAFQSSGMAYIDLILFNSFLRKEIIERFSYDKLIIVAPTEAKKLAGKGNANKDYMIGATIDNKLNDEKLVKTPLYVYMTTNELDYKNIKPIDDLVDSYWIMKSQNK